MISSGVMVRGSPRIMHLVGGLLSGERNEKCCLVWMGWHF